MSSLSRAFTQRTKRSPKPSLDGAGPLPHRSFTTKQHAFPAGTIRDKISAPIELISTTNMLSYNAPDIFPKSATSSTASGKSSLSDDDSDGSPITPESPNSSVGSIPSSPEPNHLSCYFGASTSNSGDEMAPKIPQRAPSHTKKNSEILARKRSQRMSSPKNSISTVRSTPLLRLSQKPSISKARSTVHMFAQNLEPPEPMEQHPFGDELNKVSEVAEHYGISKESLVADEEEQELISQGLIKFSANDYMSEIQGFFQTAFMDIQATKPLSSSIWI